MTLTALRSGLLEGLVHDAAGSGNAAMSSAVAGYRRHRATRHADIIGWFCCPASRLPECAAQLDGDLRLGVAVVVDNGPGAAAAALDFCARNHRLVPRAIAVDLPAERPAQAARQALTDLPDAVPGYVQVPRTRGWEKALDVIVRSGRCATLRTGGLAPEALPSAAGVAAFIRGCVTRSIPFTFTGGLAHVLRHEDPALGWQHGFLNVLAATHAALAGGRSGELVDVLEQTSAQTVRAALPQSDGDVARTREAFHGFDSSSLERPVEDLQRLGLL